MSVIQRATEVPSGLLTFCAHCHKQVSASECDKQGVCFRCSCSEAVAELRTEFHRLWSKRARYRAKGIASASIEKQLLTVVRRIRAQVQARVANATIGEAIIKEQLEVAAHPPVESRILLPTFGASGLMGDFRANA